MDYFELYYSYLAQCEKENWANMRDPNHDYMEWNHTLPQCIFGDQPIGQWLTIEQHAIVSALQTLAFKRKCLCPWHKKFLPDLLCEMSWSVVSQEITKRNLRKAEKREHPWQTTENREKGSQRQRELFENGTHPFQHHQEPSLAKSERMRQLNQERVKSGKHPFQGERGSELARKRNLRLLAEGAHPSQQPGWKEEKRRLALEQLTNGTHNFQKMKGMKYWVSKDGEIVRAREKPEGEWQNGRKWRNSK